MWDAVRKHLPSAVYLPIGYWHALCARFGTPSCGLGGGRSSRLSSFSFKTQWPPWLLSLSWGWDKIKMRETCVHYLRCLGHGGTWIGRWKADIRVFCPRL